MCFNSCLIYTINILCLLNFAWSLFTVTWLKRNGNLIFLWMWFDMIEIKLAAIRGMPIARKWVYGIFGWSIFLFVSFSLFGSHQCLYLLWILSTRFMEFFMHSASVIFMFFSFSVNRWQSSICLSGTVTILRS
jgi:hypothetical protein